MSLDFIKKMMDKLNDEVSVEDLENDVEEVKSDIYDVLKILDKYKREEAIGKIYKAKFDYHRDGNTLCIIVSFNNMKKSERLCALFSSEYIRELFRELEELNISNNFKKRIADKRNYKLDLFGDMGVYRTPYYRV